MGYLRRNLFAGLSLLLGVTALVGNGFRFTPLVIGLFALGGIWMAAVAVDGLRSRRKETLSARLADELQTGLELRDKARHASDRSDLHDAAHAFVQWGIHVNELLREAAPHYTMDMPERYPWALQGRDRVLEIMDERLRAHAALVKEFERRGS